MPRPQTRNRPLITTFFEIYGAHVDIESCTRAVGLPPSRFCETPVRTATVVPSGDPFFRRAFWVLEFEKEPSDSVEDGLSRMLGLIWEQRQEIVEFVKSNNLEAGFGSSVSIYEERPLYCLSSETLAKLAFFKASYGLDIHDYSSD